MTNEDPWYFTYEDSPEARVSDQWKTYELLCGMDMRLSNKQLGKGYPDGEREKSARAAFARLIRKGEPFPGLIRETLAAMFDPGSATVPIDRRIEFVRLHAGELASRPEAKLEIALHVWVQTYLYGKKSAAVDSATEKFGLKRSRVYAICREYADEFDFTRRLRRQPQSNQKG
jgi:hypothetical protein